MATFEKRGDYQWRAKIRLRGFPPQSKTFNTKAEAESWATVIESEMLRGVWISRSEAEQVLVRDALQRYQTEVVPHKKSSKQISSQLKLLTSYLGDYSLAALSSRVVATFRDQRLKLVDPQTVRKDLSLIRRVLNTAAKEWGIALPHGNPVQQVRLPRQPAGRDRRLQPGEEMRLLAELSDNQVIRSIVLFALETAMRRGEIAAMRWEHIDHRVRTLKIPETKTDAPRKIPLSSKAIETLHGLPRRVNGIVWSVRPDSITQAFDRACKRAEIEDLRFHDLRHEATSRLFERGFNIMEVASITGHKDLKMLKRYTHLRAEDLAKKLG